MALKIAQENAAGSVPRVPLAGIAVGDGLVDPLNMVTGYPELVFQFGLADAAQKLVLHPPKKNVMSTRLRTLIKPVASSWMSGFVMTNSQNYWRL